MKVVLTLSIMKLKFSTKIKNENRKTFIKKKIRDISQEIVDRIVAQIN